MRNKGFEYDYSEHALLIVPSSGSDTDHCTALRHQAHSPTDTDHCTALRHQAHSPTDTDHCTALRHQAHSPTDTDHCTALRHQAHSPTDTDHCTALRHQAHSPTDTDHCTALRHQAHSPTVIQSAHFAPAPRPHSKLTSATPFDDPKQFVNLKEKCDRSNNIKQKIRRCTKGGSSATSTECTFTLYDLDGDRDVTRNDMTTLVRRISDLLSSDKMPWKLPHEKLSTKPLGKYEIKLNITRKETCQTQPDSNMKVKNKHEHQNCIIGKSNNYAQVKHNKKWRKDHDKFSGSKPRNNLNQTKTEDKTFDMCKKGRQHLAGGLVAVSPLVPSRHHNRPIRQTLCHKDKASLNETPATQRPSQPKHKGVLTVHHIHHHYLHSK